MPRKLLIVLLVALVGAACSGTSTSDDRDVVGGCALQPRARCPKANLRGADLRNLDLHAIDLTGADLTSANLSGADLRGAGLARVHLDKADLTGTDLRAANLSQASLAGALLTGTDLAGANLAGANRCAVVQSDASVDNSACAPVTTTARPLVPANLPPPEITRFDLGTNCDVGVAGPQVVVRWGAQNVSRVAITYDGTLALTEDVFLRAGGDDGIPLACDGKPHIVRLEARGLNGATVSRQGTVRVGR